jgi:hypothetical protein
VWLKYRAVSLWEWLLISATALVLAGATVVLVLVLWHRHQAPHYWEE